ncbi:hypothetical protein ANTQUA_LOCUS418 [Anthophora quadrimaculata]
MSAVTSCAILNRRSPLSSIGGILKFTIPCDEEKIVHNDQHFGPIYQCCSFGAIIVVLLGFVPIAISQAQCHEIFHSPILYSRILWQTKTEI